MLVLSQEIGEAVHIGDNIVIRVLSISKYKVEIGFDAPRDIKILRKSLMDRQPKDKESKNE